MLLNEILSTHKIPTYFKDKVFTLKKYDFDFYLCLTCDGATHLAKAISNKKCKDQSNAVYSHGYAFCKGMPLVSMVNEKLDRFSHIKENTKIYKYSMLYQVFKNWQMYKYKPFEITFKLNSKHTNYYCNLLNFTDELTLTKPQKTSIVKFQKKYNYKLCLLQAV